MIRAQRYACVVIVDTLRQFLASNAIEGRLLVAVSGGIDSTALLLAFVELGGAAFEAAHVNHHLRGADSDADEAFVRELCARYDVPLHVLDAPLDPDEIRRSGIETAARVARYGKLRQLGFDWIVTAHQKNDQAETVLMRLMTGSGLAALRGIHSVRDDGVIRPLLTVTRAEIEAFLAQRGVAARNDRSNDDPRFLRNRVRKTLQDFEPSAIDGLADVAEQARVQWSVMERMINNADTSITTGDETRFMEWPEDRWMRRALLHRHIHRLDPRARDVSSADLERLADATKRTSVTANLELLHRGSEVILRRRLQPTAPFETAIRPGETIATPLGRVSLHKLQQLAAALKRRRHATTVQIQLPPLSDPTFTIRNRRDGDRFQPLGMPRQKKLKDFLIDRKIPADLRDRIPLLVWNGAIVWVAGVEVSEEFKVTDGAGEIYEVALEDENQESVQRESDRESRR